jgi:hypothetical protein
LMLFIACRMLSHGVLFPCTLSFPKTSRRSSAVSSQLEHSCSNEFSALYINSFYGRRVNGKFGKFICEKLWMKQAECDLRNAVLGITAGIGETREGMPI